MNDFHFYSPTKVFFGKGKIGELGNETKKYGKKVLMVYGKGSIKKNGIYDAVVNELNNNEIEFVEFGGVDPNPRVSTVREGVKVARENDVDFVLAVGGGSVIDCSKAIAAGVIYNGDPWDLSAWKAGIEKALPIGVVLTIAATGSEMNCGFVISNEDEEVKSGAGSWEIFPKFSILDPTYTYTVSKYQTAAGVVDIMTHVYEYYFHNIKTTFLQDRMSEAIMKTCIHYGEKAIDNPEDYEARSNIMWASSMALNGVISSGTSFDGVNHLTEHAVSAIYDLCHGAGLAIIAPYWMEYILDDSTVDRMESFARNVWDVRIENKYEAAKEGIKKTKEFYISLGMPSTFSEVGIDSSKFSDIVDKSFFGETLGELKKLNRDDLMNILNMAK